MKLKKRITSKKKTIRNVKKKINFIMNLNNKKVDLIKIKILIENKNNILDNYDFIKKNNMNIKSYFKEYIKYRKSNNNLIFLNIYTIFKNIKLLFDFLLYGKKNFIVFNIINKIVPGFYTNFKNKIKKELFFFPNVCIYLNFKKSLKAENYYYNELSKMKIFQIILQNFFSFYSKLNKFDLFVPINLRDNKENFLNILKFIKKFNNLSKILICYFEQIIFSNKIKKLRIKNKITHYWTRTNTFKIRTDFKSVMSTNSIK